MSPAFMRKIRNKNRYTVKDKAGRVFAQSTTRKKATMQVRIINK